MRWQDQGLLLSVTRHGEGAARLSILTREHGLCNGLARPQARKKSVADFPTIGTKLALEWSARLDCHLGCFRIETMNAQAAKIFDCPLALLALQSICVLAAKAMPEREPCTEFYNDSLTISEIIDCSEKWFGRYLRWESKLLAACGFGLDLSCCAATGKKERLEFLSPRTGRAISADALENSKVAPFRARLLALPQVLLESEENSTEISRLAWAEGLRVLGFFINKFIQPMPSARVQLLEAAQRKTSAAGKYAPNEKHRNLNPKIDVINPS